jgi:hypothetical protein
MDLSVLFPCAMNDFMSIWTFYLLGTLYVSTTLVWTSVLAESKVKQFHGVQLRILFGERGDVSPLIFGHPARIRGLTSPARLNRSLIPRSDMSNNQVQSVSETDVVVIGGGVASLSHWRIVDS